MMKNFIITPPSASTFRTSFSKISDQQLFSLCQKYGEQARRWKQKFAGLLPEVFRRRLFERKGFGSIFEFAAKLAGMSPDQVRLVLNLEKKFEDKPVLKKMLIEGEVSINKLARVTSIATAQNEEFLAAQVKLLPKSALETLVRDERKYENSKSAESEHLNALFKPQFDDKSLPGQTLKLDEDVQNE